MLTSAGKLTLLPETCCLRIPMVLYYKRRRLSSTFSKKVKVFVLFPKKSAFEYIPIEWGLTKASVYVNIKRKVFSATVRKT